MDRYIHMASPAISDNDERYKNTKRDASEMHHDRKFWGGRVGEQKSMEMLWGCNVASPWKTRNSI
jgi:hypothetical protein